MFNIRLHKCSNCQYNVFNINGPECFYDPLYLNFNTEDKEILTREEEFYVDKNGNEHIRYEYGPITKRMKEYRWINFKTAIVQLHKDIEMKEVYSVSSEIETVLSMNRKTTTEQMQMMTLRKP